MPSFILAPESFQHLNGFYRRTECREVVYRLYNRTCQGCRADLSARNDYVSGHILAARHAQFFERLFPGLDVDNLLNLHLLCSACNIRQSAYHFDSPFFLNQVFKESARAIDLRYTKVSSELSCHLKDPNVVHQMQKLDNFEIECQKLHEWVRGTSGSVVVLHPEVYSRIHMLIREILRDDRGRLCSVAAHLKNVAWFAEMDGDTFIGEAIAKENPALDNIDSIVHSLAESKGFFGGVAFRKPLLSLLRAIREGIRAHRKASATGASICWEETPKSLIFDRLSKVRSTILENGGGELIEDYANSYCLLSLDDLSAAEYAGWVGWPESEANHALDKIGSRIGGYSRLQAYWLLTESAATNRIQARLHSPGGGWRVVSGGDDCNTISACPPQKGLWFNSNHLDSRGGMPVSTLPRVQWMKLQLTLFIINLSCSAVDEDGNVSCQLNPSLEDWFRRLAHKDKGWRIAVPDGGSQRRNTEELVKVEALEDLASKFPSLLQELIANDAWAVTSHAEFPDYMLRTVARHISDDVRAKAKLRG